LHVHTDNDNSKRLGLWWSQIRRGETTTTRRKQSHVHKQQQRRRRLQISNSQMHWTERTTKQSLCTPTTPKTFRTSRMRCKRDDNDSYDDDDRTFAAATVGTTTTTTTTEREA
jgi:hypothetical protein